MKTFDEWMNDNPQHIAISERYDLEAAWDAALAERDKETCEWTPSESRGMTTGHGHSIYPLVGVPFCPFCGKRIAIKSGNETDFATKESEAKK